MLQGTKSKSDLNVINEESPIDGDYSHTNSEKSDPFSLSTKQRSETSNINMLQRMKSKSDLNGTRESSGRDFSRQSSYSYSEGRDFSRQSSYEKIEPLSLSSKQRSQRFSEPTLTRSTSVTESKMLEMREKFMALQADEDAEGEVDLMNETTATTDTMNVSTKSKFSKWDKIKQVVVKSKSLKSSSSAKKISFAPEVLASDMNPAEEQDEEKLLEIEDIFLTNFFKDNTIQLPPMMKKHQEEGENDDIPADLTRLPEMTTTLAAEKEFSEETKEINIVISQIPEKIVNEHREAIEAKAAEERREMLNKIKKKQLDIESREVIARNALWNKEKIVQEKIAAEKLKIAETILKKERNLSQDFKRVRERLEEGIERQEGAVVEHFGKLLVHEESLARRFMASSILAPQPIEMRIHVMRAVKNKLSKGTYVLMLTQYDSLGGRPLSWSRIGSNGIGNLRPGITKSFHHSGRYFDRVLRVEDSCYALCPPRPLLRPNFVFVLELFQLASKYNPEDKIEAWTAVPMSYESMSLIEGKIKLPLMRGEHTSTIQHFKDMELAMSKDLNNWLCNIYIEIRHFSLQELGVSDADLLKRVNYDLDYLNKAIVTPQEEVLKVNEIIQKLPHDSHEVPHDIEIGLLDDQEVDHSLRLSVDKGIFRRKLNVNSSQGQGLNGQNTVQYQQQQEINNDTELGIIESSKMAPPLRLQISTEHKKSSQVNSEGIFSKLLGSFSKDHKKLDDLETQQPLLLSNHDNMHEHKLLVLNKWKKATSSSSFHGGPNNESFRSAASNPILNHHQNSIVRERGYNIQDELFLHEQQRGKLAGVETVQQLEDKNWAKAGLEGKIVRRWQSDGLRYDSEAIADKDADIENEHTRILSKPIEWIELRDTREMEDYTMACADPSRKKSIVPGAKARSKLRYMYYELFGDFSYYLWGTFEFYMSILLYVLAFLIRIYIHYIAEYLYLLLSYKFMADAVSVPTQVVVVAIGPLANLAIFICLILFGTTFYVYADFLPEVFSKFFAAYGLAVVFDPLLVILIDLIYHNYNCSSYSSSCKDDYTSSDCHCFDGDFVKLYYKTQSTEGSGITGLFITIILYMSTTILGCLLLYQYLVYIHRHGKILDQWRRINGTFEEFFIPADFEVSYEEMSSVIHKAKNWRGPGESRRVLKMTQVNSVAGSNFGGVINYDINEVNKAGVTISIYRKFQMEVDTGAIIEIFSNKSTEKEQNVSIFYNDTTVVNQTGSTKSNVIHEDNQNHLLMNDLDEGNQSFSNRKVDFLSALSSSLDENNKSLKSLSNHTVNKGEGNTTPSDIFFKPNNSNSQVLTTSLNKNIFHDDEDDDHQLPVIETNHYDDDSTDLYAAHPNTPTPKLLKQQSRF